MAIQAQVPVPTQTAPSATGADLLAFLSGKPTEARVVGFTVEGLTQLLLGKGIIKLALPTNFPAGTVLTLQIKGGQLLVQPQTSGGSGALPGRAVPVPVAATPLPLVPPPVVGAPVNLAGPRLAMPAPSAMPAPPAVANGAGQPAAAAPMHNGAGPPAGAAMPAMQAPVSPATALQAQLQASIMPGGPLGAPVNFELPAGLQGVPLLPQALPTPQGQPVSQELPTPQGAQPGATGVSVALPVPVAGNFAAAPLAGMLQESSAPPKLDGMGALLANLAVFEGRLAEFPAPVAAAVRQFLGQQINLARGRLTGERLQQAIVGAGILAGEADEAAGLGARLGVPGETEQLKASLMQLQRALVGWVGQERNAGVPVARPAPPSRPGAPRAARITEPSPLPEEDAPKETGRKLLEQTDTALGRLRPAHAGGSEPLNRPDPAQAAPRSEWAGQVPMFLGQEAGLAQFQISRDGGSAGMPETRSWQVRFAINFSVIGEVGAHVLLRGKRASVTLWAERDDTADALDTMLPELSDAFAVAGLETGSIQCRHGVPRAVPVAAGGLVDSVR